jgi:putative membrane protein
MHNVPETGPVVLAARHYHQVYDGIALLSTMPRPVHLVISVDWARNYAHRVALHGLAYVAAWPVLLRSERVIQSAHEPSAPRCVFQPEEVHSYRRICLQQCDDLLCDGGFVYRREKRWSAVMRFGSPYQVASSSETDVVVAEIEARVRALCVPA